MIIRPARLTDFAHLETFVWQAIFPAFDVAGLTDAQRAENDALVEGAREEIGDVLGRDHFAVYVAIEPKGKTLAGYIIVNARPGAYAEIKRLIVKRAFRGKGVAQLLLDEATDFIGRDRAVSLEVRHYNARAIAFFTKHGFVDTGEFSGNYAINRKLMLREANTIQAAAAENTTATNHGFGADFPTEADEPVFAPLPDYRLATDETPLYEPGVNALRTEDLTDSPVEETSLSDEQLSVLEAFIAKARAQKAKDEPVKTPPRRSSFDRSKITFEVDYGANEPAEEPDPVSVQQAPAPKRRPKPSFAFDFAPVTEAEPEESVSAPADRPQAGASAPPPTSAVAPETTAVPRPTPTVSPAAKPAKQKKKPCPECATKLPAAARFCYVCGLPQEAVTPQAPPAEDLLELKELPSEPESNSVTTSKPTGTTVKEEAPAAEARSQITTGQLRKAFRTYLEGRITAYFGTKAVPKYLARMEEAAAFQQVRDGSLSSLATWLNNEPPGDVAKVRRQNTFADLTEYFIVEAAGDLSGNVLPQRLLRHQSVNWQTADLFKLVMDYLDFASETETVHTDFVSMPARALRNATKSFLHAPKDERVFFICDQSLISQAKNGFAVTDSGIYWKNVLQPAGAATFTTMQAPKLEQGHLVIDGQFFDAGGRLNLKIAVLLDKLRRMR